MNNYEKYIGQKVLVEETIEKLYLKSRGKYVDFINCDLKKEDTVIAKLAEEANKVGLSLRTWLPGMMGTTDYRLDRLNVRVEKQEDGSYEITRIYFG